MDVVAIFAKYEDEFLKFDRIENPIHRRPDICAFILLDLILGKGAPARDMVRGAEHDIIYLDVQLDQLSSATEEQLCDLCRCGVIVDEDTESLAMFV